MNTKLKKWTPAVVMFLLSLLIMFGFYFIYKNVQIKQPIENQINQIAGVSVKDIEITKDKIQLTIFIDNIDNFQETYHSIVEKVKPYQDTRVIDYNFESNEDKQILRAWNESYFYVAEAIANKHYSLIPEAINHLQKELLLDKAEYSMDSNNIYIDLHKGDKAQYFIIERNQEVKEVG